ncbi:MAG: hydrolase [Planctomycetes bacterium]|nr:hydrolase [Planctomycetota bacterium]
MLDRSALHPCACCGYLTLSEPGHDSYDICPICFWEDDPVQVSDPEIPGGANRVSLRQARANFAAFGACERDAIRHVRAPLPDEPRAQGRRDV